MALKENENEIYQWFQFIISYSKCSASWKAVLHGSDYLLNSIKDKTVRGVIICANGWKKNFWQEEAKEIKWVKEMLDSKRFDIIYPSEKGLEIEDIISLAKKGYKEILICELKSINGPGYPVLEKLFAISRLYNCSIRVATDEDIKPYSKFDMSEYEYGFIDYCTFMFDDPNDKSKTKSIFCVPAGIKERIPKTK